MCTQLAAPTIKLGDSSLLRSRQGLWPTMLSCWLLLSHTYLGVESEAYDKDESRFHEAGYDAYITGFSYLRMAYHIGI